MTAARKANIVFQDTGLKAVVDLESKAKRYNYTKYMNFPYKDERAVSGSVEIDIASSSAVNLNRRRLRILACLLDVAWTTDLTTTRTAVAAAVTALSL